MAGPRGAASSAIQVARIRARSRRSSIPRMRTSRGRSLSDSTPEAVTTRTATISPTRRAASSRAGPSSMPISADPIAGARPADPHWLSKISPCGFSRHPAVLGASFRHSGVGLPESGNAMVRQALVPSGRRRSALVKTRSHVIQNASPGGPPRFRSARAGIAFLAVRRRSTVHWRVLRHGRFASRTRCRAVHLQPRLACLASGRFELIRNVVAGTEAHFVCGLSAAGAWALQERPGTRCAGAKRTVPKRALPQEPRGSSRATRNARRELARGDRGDPREAP